MKCECFLTWLENRDTHDVSEADRAHKHAAECEHCGGLLKKDEYLDWFIAKSMASQSAPEELKTRIDLSLNRSVVRRPGKGMIAAVAALCLIVAAIFAMNMGQERFATMDELGTFALVDYRDHGQRESIYEPVKDAGSWLVANGRNDTVPPPHLIEGYTLKGARFCQLGHCQAVHMIYERNGELVSVFIVEAAEIGFHLEQGRLYTLAMEGINVKMYRQLGTVYALVG